MPKVDWITWKTEEKDIVNPNKELEKIEDQYQNYHVYMNSVVTEGIKSEMVNGGLDPLSLNLIGTSPANEKAKEILKEIEEIQIEYESLKKKIEDSLNNQKRTEKEQLIEALDHKIIEEERILNNTISLRDRINQSGIPENIQKLRLDDIIEDSNNRINQLKERLDRIKAL